MIFKQVKVYTPLYIVFAALLLNIGPFFKKTLVFSSFNFYFILSINYFLNWYRLNRFSFYWVAKVQTILCERKWGSYDKNFFHLCGKNIFLLKV